MTTRSYHIADAGEQRAHPRARVSLPMRFTEDGRTFEDGVVISLGAGGLFLQSDTLPAMRTQVWVEIGLGADRGVIAGTGRVVNLNRRIGDEVIFGFGLELDAPPADLEARLEALQAACPGAVNITPVGYVEWPIYAGADRETGGNGLMLWSAGRWLGPEAPEGDAGALGRPVDGYLGTILELLESGTARDEPFAELAYRGRVLTPQDGIPFARLRQALEPGGRHLWLDVLAVQMRLVDDLGASRWRLEQTFPEQLASLEEAGAHARALIDRIDPDEGADDDERASLAQARVGLEALERFVARVVWSSRTALPAGQAAERYERWVAAQSAPMTARITRRAPDTNPRIVPPRAASPQATSSRRTLALLGVLFAAALAFGAWRLAEYRELTRPPAVRPLEARVFDGRVPMVSFEVTGTTVDVVVPVEWARRPHEERLEAFTSLCWVLTSNGYATAFLHTPDGYLVGNWLDGRVRVSPYPG